MRFRTSLMAAAVGGTWGATAVAAEPGAFLKFKVYPEKASCALEGHESSPTRPVGKVEFALPADVVLEKVVIHRGIEAQKLGDLEFSGNDVKSAGASKVVEIKRADAE